MLTIDEASPGDVADLSQRITEFDAAELRAAGLSVEAAVGAVPAQALRRHGELVCLFGAVPHPAVAAAAIPWMLCTGTLDRVPRRAMAAVSAQVVAGWRSEFSHLSNLVHRRHVRAVRFVEWLGFKVDRTPTGPGQNFFMFEWSRDV